MLKLAGRKKTRRPEGAGKEERKLLLGSGLLGLALGIFLFYFTRNLPFLFLLPLSFLAFAKAFYPSYALTKAQKKNREGKKTYLAFYDRYYLYSSLEGSFVQGFRLAAEKLETTGLKDSLTDYLDGKGKGPLPLSLTNSPRENALRETVQRELSLDEEVSAGSLSFLKRRIEAYRREEGEKKDISSYSVPVLLFFLYFALVLFSLYVPKA